MKSGNLTLVVVELEAHAIVNLVILESDVLFVDVVPLLDPNLVGPRTSLSRHKLLQVTYGVIVVALHTNLLPQPIVQHHFYHLHTSQINNPFFSHSHKFWGGRLTSLVNNVEVFRSFIVFSLLLVYWSVLFFFFFGGIEIGVYYYYAILYFKSFLKSVINY